MKTAPIGQWHPTDFIKGLYIAIISAVLTTVITMVQQGHLIPDANGWKQIGGVVMIATMTYLGKQIGTNSQDKFLAKEPIDNIPTINPVQGDEGQKKSL